MTDRLDSINLPAPRDFREAGIGQKRADAAARACPSLRLTQVHQQDLVPGSGIVALVPTGDWSRDLIRDFGFYGRDGELNQRISTETEYLGYVEKGEVRELYRITARLTVGSGQAVVSPEPGNQAVVAPFQNVMSAVNLQKEWGYTSVFFKLDHSNPLAFNLPTGYKRKEAGLRSVQHYSLSKLQSASQSGRTLSDLPSE